MRSLAAVAEANSTAFSKVRGVGEERMPGARASAKVFRKSSLSVEPKLAEEATASGEHWPAKTTWRFR